MANDRVTRLQKYVDDLKGRLSRGETSKHKDSPEAIREWIKRDIRKHEAIIEKLTK